jgi:hypothetical protein
VIWIRALALLKKRDALWILALVVVRAGTSRAQAPDGGSDRFVNEATQFLQEEIAAHVLAVKSLDPPQPTVLGVPTQGDFTWGSFMRALTDVTALTGATTVAGQDVPRLLGRLGLIEASWERRCPCEGSAPISRRTPSGRA